MIGVWWILYVWDYAQAVWFSIEKSIHKKTKVCFNLSALTQQSYESGDMHYLWRQVYHHVHMVNDEITWSYWFTLRAKCSLWLVTSLHSKRRIQRIQFHNSSAPLSSAELGLVAKPTGMSHPWNSPPLNPLWDIELFSLLRLISVH